jgi:hypothetical protein
MRLRDIKHSLHEAETRHHHRITSQFHPVHSQFNRSTQLLNGDFMTGQQERVLEACRRVQSFMDANATLLDSINKSATRKELDTVTTELSDSAGVQATGQVAATGNRRTNASSASRSATTCSASPPSPRCGSRTYRSSHPSRAPGLINRPRAHPAPQASHIDLQPTG